jgi:outer membrane PBP1 activator LpoA protein
LFCALQAASEPLRAKEIGCVFALSPADNPVTAAAFLAAGYKRTGLLSRHLQLGDRRVDALLWTRRSVTADADAA